MTPLAFYRHTQGVRRNNDRTSMQWREMMSLLYALKRTEKMKKLTGKDFWPLAVDKNTEVIVPKHKRISKARFARLLAIANQPVTPIQ